MNHIQEMIRAQAPEDQESYAQGLIEAATWFAWWKNGTQWCGSGMITLKDFKKEVKEAI